MNSSLYQPLQTLFTSWQPTPRPRRPSLPRGRTENCKTNPNQRRWRRRWKRRVEQRLPTTTAPRTEPEKEGSVNRSVTSSPPPSRYAYWPLLSCTHWASPLTPSLTLTPPSYLVIIYLQGAKKRRDAETPAELQNVQNLLLNPPPPASSSIYLRPRNTMQKLMTKLKMELESCWWLWIPKVWDPDGKEEAQEEI